MKPQLLVLNDHEGELAAAPAMARLRDLVEVTILNRPLGPEDYAGLAKYHFLFALRERTQINGPLLDQFPNLELILQSGGHYYHLDKEAATARGILIALGRGAKRPMILIPELTFGLILGLSRQIYQGHQQMSSGAWPEMLGESIHGRTLGILGYGRHGKPIGRIARGFGMKIVAWDRGGDYSDDEPDVRRLRLEELMTVSDVVSVHLRLSDLSRGLITKELLHLMKPSAFLINTARGAIVDEEGLIEVLQEGKIAGAGLDVFTHEPLAENSPLRSLPNVLLTPHIGWKVSDLLHEWVEIAANQLETYLNGALDPRYVPNAEALEMARHRLGRINKMTKPNLLILDDYEGVLAQAPALDSLKRVANVTILNQPLTTDRYHLLEQQHILLALRERTIMNRQFLEACHDVELVLQTGSNAYHLDRAAASERGILVALGRGATKNRISVPELVFGFMVGLARNIHGLTDGVKAGIWTESIGHSLGGRTLGIIGYGRQGSSVARIAQAFNMQVIAWNRSENRPEVDADGVRFLPLDALLAQADVLSIHLKLSDESRGFLTRERIYAMKQGAILINTSRGAIIDEEAMTDALMDGQLSGAGLDVFTTEPLPENSRLRSLSNVLLTPHIGWKVEEVLHEFVEIVARHCVAYLSDGLDPAMTMNPEAWEIKRPRHGTLLMK